jgi:hypothetical protein
MNNEPNNASKNFSKYEYVEFDLYGDGSGNRLEFRFHTKGFPIYTWLNITHTGWKHYVLPRSAFTIYPGASWEKIDSVRFFNPDGTAMNIKLDNLRLLNIPSPTPPYQIASFDNWNADGWFDSRNQGHMAQENTIVKEGTGSMKINWPGTVYDVVPRKIFAPVQDWSNYQNWAVSMWVYRSLGDNSRLNQIIIYDSANHTGRYTVPVPASAGWTKVIAKLSDFVWDGGVTPAQVSWNAIKMIDLFTSCHPTSYASATPIYMDDFQIGTPPPLPSLAWVMNAQKAMITVDGNPADWAGLTDSDELDFDLKAVPIQPNGDLRVTYKLAWDDNYLYVLVKELPGDIQATEAPSLAALNNGNGGDILYDSLALFYDFTNTHITDNLNGSISLWQILGLSSTGRTDLMMAWANGKWGPHDPNSITNGSVATSGSLGSRVVEAKLKWSDLASALTSDRQPAGGLVAAIEPGYVFGCDPRLADLENSWAANTALRGAAWLNGKMWAPGLPSGKDFYSVDVRLICKTADLTGDCNVDLQDFAILGSEWQKTDCSDLNGYCNGADIMMDGSVVLSDMVVFASKWLD